MLVVRHPQRHTVQDVQVQMLLIFFRFVFLLSTYQLRAATHGIQDIGLLYVYDFAWQQLTKHKME